MHTKLSCSCLQLINPHMIKKTRGVPVTPRTYPARPRWPTGYAVDAQFSERTKPKEQKNKGGSSNP